MANPIDTNNLVLVLNASCGDILKCHVINRLYGWDMDFSRIPLPKGETEKVFAALNNVPKPVVKIPEPQPVLPSPDTNRISSVPVFEDVELPVKKQNGLAPVTEKVFAALNNVPKPVVKIPEPQPVLPSPDTNRISSVPVFEDVELPVKKQNGLAPVVVSNTPPQSEIEIDGKTYVDISEITLLFNTTVANVYNLASTQNWQRLPHPNTRGKVYLKSDVLESLNKRNK